MHHAIEIVLQLKKIKRVITKAVNIIVVHPRALKLEAYRTTNPLLVPNHDHLPIFNISE